MKSFALAGVGVKMESSSLPVGKGRWSSEKRAPVPVRCVMCVRPGVEAVTVSPAAGPPRLGRDPHCGRS